MDYRKSYNIYNFMMGYSKSKDLCLQWLELQSEHIPRFRDAQVTTQDVIAVVYRRKFKKMFSKEKLARLGERANDQSISNQECASARIALKKALSEYEEREPEIITSHPLFLGFAMVSDYTYRMALFKTPTKFLSQAAKYVEKPRVERFGWEVKQNVDALSDEKRQFMEQRLAKLTSSGFNALGGLDDDSFD